MAFELFSYMLPSTLTFKMLSVNNMFQQIKNKTQIYKMECFVIVISSNELNFYYCCFAVFKEQYFLNFLTSTNKPDVIFY